MADLKKQSRLPQEGTDRTAGGESLTDISSVCPTYSGGGKVRSPKSTGGENEEEKMQETLKELIDPFARRGSLRRTPPGHTKLQDYKSKNNESDTSTENGEDDILQHEENESPTKDTKLEEDRRPKKRKKVSSPTIVQPNEIEPPEELKKIKAKVEEFVKFTTQNKKVHNEVKKFALDLTSLVRQTVSKYKHDIAKFYELQQEFNTYRISQEQRVSELAEQIEEVKQNYEKRFCELKNNMHKTSENSDKKFNLNKQEIKEYDQLMTKLNVEWSPDSFVNVTVDHGDIFKEVRNNVVYFCEEQLTSQSRTGKRVLNRYPEALEGERIRCEGGSYSIIEQSVTLLSAEETKTKVNKVVITFYDPTKQDGRSQHDVFKLCQEVKKLAVKYNMTEISIVTPQGIATDIMKKILEVIFHNTETTIFMRARKNKTTDKVSKYKDRNEEVIIIEGASDSYAQVLKKLKNGLKGSNVLEQIKGVRKSNNGDVIVKLRENALEVSKTIKDIVENKKVKTFTKNPLQLLVLQYR